MIIIAMALGGIIEKTGCLEAILFALLNKLNGRAQLMTAVLFSTIGFNFASNAFIAYTLPGRIFAPAFRGIGLSTTNVSRGLEDGATMSAPLIPWNSGGAFVANTLGVPTIIYAPFAFANWLSPIFNLIWAWTGFFVPKAGKDEIQRWIYSDETIFVNGHMTTASKFDLKSIFENNYVQDTS